LAGIISEDENGYHFQYDVDYPSDRLFAQQYPVGFLETYQNGVILDQVQYVPELFSYLQVFTDAR
jgi:hypothetical protein